MKEVYLDTSFFIALVNTSDLWHSLAKKWANDLEENRTICHTSIPILFEIADGFSRIIRREIGIELIENILGADNYIVHPLNTNIYNNALCLYKSRKDKEWGLTDCYSFELMRKLNLNDVLTSDRHFQQFGFNILLKDD